MDRTKHNLEFSCELEDSGIDTNFVLHEGFFKFLKNFSWENVPEKAYKSPDGSWKGVRRYEIVKGKDVHLRYFEIERGGFSTLEKHEHEHIVLCIRGEGIVVFGNQFRRMKPYDVVHISSWQPHQFVSDKETFGFICIVPANRDRPRKLSREEVEELLRRNPQLSKVIRF